ncbi:MAG: hypothetical protein AB8B85_23050 [Paracoccaceae bacterium]
MSLTIRGQQISDEDVRAMIDTLVDACTESTKTALVEIFRTETDIPAEDADYWAKRYLRYAADSGWIRFNPETASYERLETDTKIHRLLKAEEPKPATSPVPDPPETAPEVPERAFEPGSDGLSPLARFICFLISSAAVLSVVSINGLYAASIAGTAVLGIILITAMVAIDLMRPFLVGIALISFRKRLWTRFAGALALALILAPLSVYTSFSMFSAEFSRGANARVDARQDAEVQRTYRETLAAEIVRLRALSAAQWGQWQSECGNGGCGPQAGRLQDAAQATDTEIKVLVAKRQSANQSSPRQIDQAAMITTSLTVFGIPEGLVVQVAPLMLALGLELAAIFGPAILLVPISPGKPPRRGPGTPRKRPSRAGRFANPNHVKGEPS